MVAIGELAKLLDRTGQLRIYERRVPSQPPRKRRDLVPALAHLESPDCIAELVQALTVRAGTAVMDWLTWPDLHLDLRDSVDQRLTVIGLLLPDWIRCEPDGDVQLDDPLALARWLVRWAPEAATVASKRQPGHSGLIVED
jgi:hypothetical protein